MEIYPWLKPIISWPYKQWSKVRPFGHSWITVGCNQQLSLNGMPLGAYAQVCANHRWQQQTEAGLKTPYSLRLNPRPLRNAETFDVNISLNLRGIFNGYLYTSLYLHVNWLRHYTASVVTPTDSLCKMLKPQTAAVGVHSEALDSMGGNLPPTIHRRNSRYVFSTVTAILENLESIYFLLNFPFTESIFNK